MTQFSMLPWETQTGTGDGANSYTQDQANNFFRYFDVRDPANEGVAYGVLNALAVSGTASPLSVASGTAVCYGRYWNDAAVTLAVTTPVVGTTGGRVVLRADWSANTIRLFVKMSTDGNAAIPALVQTAGTTWEISLATFTITTGGVITVTDNRTFIKVTGKLGAGDIDDVGMIANALITGAKVASETLVPANMTNRTRKFFVFTPNGYDLSAGEIGHHQYVYGVEFPDTHYCWVYGRFTVPVDFVSDLVVRPIWVAGATGNVYRRVTADYGAVGAAYNDSSYDSGWGTLAIGATYTNVGSETHAFGSVAAGDIVTVVLSRDATSGSDTVSGYVYASGFVVEYTADS